MEEKRKAAQKQGKDAIDEDDPEKVGFNYRCMHNIFIAPMF